MKHKIIKIISVKIIGKYTLELTFDDKKIKVINFEPVLRGEMFSPLKDLSFFNRVTLDPEVHTIVWPNGADFDPAILRDWEKYIDEIERRSRKWDLIEN